MALWGFRYASGSLHNDYSYPDSASDYDYYQYDLVYKSQLVFING